MTRQMELVVAAMVLRGEDGDEYLTDEDFERWMPNVSFRKHIELVLAADFLIEWLLDLLLDSK
jgi:hypothetical protein